MTDPAADSPAENDASDADPFFSLNGPSHWNAFVGRQSEERYYIDGFLEAAVELATSVIEKKLSGQRDTLAMPILFTARHGLELSLKHAVSVLASGGILAGGAPENHDIAALWERLSAAPKCDAHLPILVSALEPYVRSLAAVDDDGQALRYYRRRDGELSLTDRSLVNLEVVLTSLRTMQQHLIDLGYRTVDLVEEKRSGTCTDACSRSDLFMIASRLPPREDWRSDAFENARLKLREDFGLSGRQLSDALNLIQGHRQLGSMIGIEFELAHLKDETANFAVELWRSLNPRQPAQPLRASLIIPARKISLEEIERTEAALKGAAKTLSEKASEDELVDLETIYQIGRSSRWPEEYEAWLGRTKAEQKSPAERTTYLLGKGNFQDALAEGVARLGRLRLGEALKAL